jgi:hypothetical protein
MLADETQFYAAGVALREFCQKTRQEHFISKIVEFYALALLLNSDTSV